MIIMTILTIAAIGGFAFGVVMLLNSGTRPAGALLIVIAFCLGVAVSMANAQRDLDHAYVEVGPPAAP